MTDLMADFFERPPRLPYAAVYRLALPAPTESIDVASSGGLRVRIVPSEIAIRYTVPVVAFEAGSVAATFAQRRLTLPPATYAIVEVEIDPSLDEGPTSATGAALRSAEVGCVMELLHSGLTHAKEFEGVVTRPGHFATSLEGPLHLVALPNTPPEEVGASIATAVDALNVLDVARRSRFQLCARWFRRGHEAVNVVDQFLFYWTVLEIFPGERTSDVPRAVVDLLRRDVYPMVPPEVLKQRIGIGRMFGTRSRIVHDGLAFVTDFDVAFHEQLSHLRAVVRVCLRLLAGMEPGRDLDMVVQSSANGAA